MEANGEDETQLGAVSWFYFFPARFFSCAFAFSSRLCSALSPSRLPITFFILSLYALSCASFLSCATAARKRLSFRNSRIAPFFSCRYCARSFAAAARSASLSFGRRYDDDRDSNLGI